MDIRCPRCGEPWDHDELHYVGEFTGEEISYAKARSRFQTEGCGVFGIKCERTGSLEAQVASTLYDLLGDDMDGAAAMLEDLGL